MARLPPVLRAGYFPRPTRLSGPSPHCARSTGCGTRSSTRAQATAPPSRACSRVGPAMAATRLRAREAGGVRGRARGRALRPRGTSHAATTLPWAAPTRGRAGRRDGDAAPRPRRGGGGNSPHPNPPYDLDPTWAAWRRGGWSGGRGGSGPAGAHLVVPAQALPACADLLGTTTTPRSLRFPRRTSRRSSRWSYLRARGGDRVRPADVPGCDAYDARRSGPVADGPGASGARCAA